MKVAKALILTTFCAGAVSAFGLPGPASTVKNAVNKAGFASKPMVQAVDVRGNRMSSMVSVQSLPSSTSQTPLDALCRDVVDTRWSINSKGQGMFIGDGWCHGLDAVVIEDIFFSDSSNDVYIHTVCMARESRMESCYCF